MIEPWKPLRLLLDALERLSVPYAVGGSLASSIHGVPRATVDVDLVVQLPASRIGAFSEQLQPDFYADPDVIEEAVEAERPFNLIHYESSYKFDLFPLPDDPYYRSELERRRFTVFSPVEGETLRFAVVSAEDTISTKLVWYRAGGETSERQWNELRGVVSVRAADLDHGYLAKWAKHLGVDDLLARLMTVEGL